MDNNNQVSRSINLLYHKCKKKAKKDIESKVPTKKIISLENAINLLSKNKLSRTKQENKILGHFLAEHFDYFKKLRESGEEQKLGKIMSVLNLEIFKPGQEIIRFGEEGNKFYILINGKVTLFKPIYVQKEMKLKEYISLMEDLKNNPSEDLKYKRINEKNAYLNLDLEMLFNMNKNTYHMNRPLTFFIEEDQNLGEFGQGFAFGEIALIKRCTRNATIISSKNSWLVSIDKSDYNKIMRELEEKRLEKQLEDFKKEYPIFKGWTLNQMIRLFNCFSQRTLTQGEYLYKQNEDSDTIYIIKSGIFEVYSMVSFGWLNDFFGYIISAKNNLVYLLDSQEKQLKDTELREFFDEISKNIEPSPCQYDPLRVAKITTSNNKEDCFVDIKREEEEINDPYNLFKILIRVINYKEVIGIEDALEMKKRYNFVKCVSPHAEVLKVSLYDFFRLVNINPEPQSKKILMNIIANKKAILFKKILHSARKKSHYYTRAFDFKYEKLVENEQADLKEKIMVSKLRDKDNIEINPMAESPLKLKLMNKKPKLNTNKFLTLTTTNTSSNNTSYNVSLSIPNNSRSVRKKKSISISMNLTKKYSCCNTEQSGSLNNDQKLLINHKIFRTEKLSPIRSKTIRFQDKSPTIVNQSRFSHFYLLSKQISSFETNENSNINQTKSNLQKIKKGLSELSSVDLIGGIQNNNNHNTLFHTKTTSGNIKKSIISLNEISTPMRDSNTKTSTITEKDQDNFDIKAIASGKKMFLMKNFTKHFFHRGGNEKTNNSKMPITIKHKQTS